jgi:hypothetical protein
LIAEIGSIKKNAFMTLGRFFRLFIPLYLGCIPLITVAIAEASLTARYGEQAYENILGIALGIFAAGCITPPAIILWRLFGGGKTGMFHFWGRGKKARAIIETGRPAMAEILQSNEKSGGLVITLNEQPLMNLLLRIEDGESPPYELSIDAIVARTDVPYFQPGRRIPVKLDAAGGRHAVFDAERWDAMQKEHIKNDGWTEHDRVLLEEKGNDAIVKIIGIKDTGLSRDFLPVVKLLFEVSLSGKSPYRAERELALDEEKIKLIGASAGKSFRARVHPHDREKVRIDFEKPA